MSRLWFMNDATILNIYSSSEFDKYSAEYILFHLIHPAIKDINEQYCSFVLFSSGNEVCYKDILEKNIIRDPDDENIIKIKNVFVKEEDFLVLYKH